MMEYRIFYYTDEDGNTEKRVTAPNPIDAINEVLEQSDTRVWNIHRIETIIETEEGETVAESDLRSSKIEQHVKVELTK